MRTFEVSKVEWAERPRAVLDRKSALDALLSTPGTPGPPGPPIIAGHNEIITLERAREIQRLARRVRIEQTYESTATLVACTDVNPLVQMAHDAFYEHRPITLTPDVVWFTIAQGFATHVNMNAEALRHHFVQHEGKRKLVVDRPDFILGQPNPWPEVFAAFSSQIAGHVGKLRDLVVADFSTTGPLERAATEVLLMDAFQAYFEYEMNCGCGIPQITLLGTPDDWRSLRRRAQHLSEYGLEHWISLLLPILDRIVATSEGGDDPEFWRSFFHYESGSRGSALTGWINVLFPYLLNSRSKRPTVPNPYMAAWKDNVGNYEDGPSMTEIPSGLAGAPVRCVDARTDDTCDLRFIAGMFGVVEDAAGVLAPEFGWAVTYA